MIIWMGDGHICTCARVSVDLKSALLSMVWAVVGSLSLTVGWADGFLSRCTGLNSLKMRPG